MNSPCHSHRRRPVFRVASLHQYKHRSCLLKTSSHNFWTNLCRSRGPLVASSSVPSSSRGQLLRLQPSCISTNMTTSLWSWQDQRHSSCFAQMPSPLEAHSPRAESTRMSTLVSTPVLRWCQAVGVGLRYGPVTFSSSPSTGSIGSSVLRSQS